MHKPHHPEVWNLAEKSVGKLVYHSPGAAEPGHDPGGERWARREFWEGNLRKQQLGVWLRSYCKMQGLAQEKLGSSPHWGQRFGLVPPLGTSRSPGLPGGEGRTDINSIALFSCIFMCLTCWGQAAISIPWHVRPGGGYSRLGRHCKSESPDPWNEHTEKALNPPPAYHKQNIALSTQESMSPKGFQRLMELSLSSCLGVLPTSGVFNLTTIDFGGELSDVDYQSSYSKTALQVGEVSSFCVLWGGIRWGCMYLEREGIRSSTLRFLFWMTFYFCCVHLLSSKANLKPEN